MFAHYFEYYAIILRGRFLWTHCSLPKLGQGQRLQSIKYMLDFPQIGGHILEMVHNTNVMLLCKFAILIASHTTYQTASLLFFRFNYKSQLTS